MRQMLGRTAAVSRGFWDKELRPILVGIIITLIITIGSGFYFGYYFLARSPSTQDVIDSATKTQTAILNNQYINTQGTIGTIESLDKKISGSQAEIKSTIDGLSSQFNGLADTIKREILSPAPRGKGPAPSVAPPPPANSPGGMHSPEPAIVSNRLQPSQTVALQSPRSDDINIRLTKYFDFALTQNRLASQKFDGAQLKLFADVSASANAGVGNCSMDAHIIDKNGKDIITRHGMQGDSSVRTGTAREALAWTACQAMVDRVVTRLAEW